MANLKEIRIRIDSVHSTKQITSAMKLVAASKLRRAQNAIIKLRPYANKLRSIMQNVSQGVEENEEIMLFTEARKVEKVLLIPIASNKGLCGAFNGNVIKTVLRLVENDYKEYYNSKNVDIISIGKKVGELLKSKKIIVTESHEELLNNISYEKISELSDKVIEEYKKGNYDKVVIIYNRFKNAATQILEIEQLLPITSSEEQNSADEINYIYEPDKTSLLKGLIPQTLRIQIFKAVLDSFASEQGARMTAMHKATDNAEELIKELKLHYNKVRQATITNEIIEIVGGAEALK
jgi:F-type H+-transporting ATPase subunit gamma